MLEAQWRLTVVTFVSVPLTIIIMKVWFSPHTASCRLDALI